MSWSTSELRVRLAPLNRFKPSSKIFYWPFQGGTSFVDLLCFCSVLCLLCFVRVCLYVLRGHLLGKGWPLGSRLWCLLWVCHFPIGILGQVWYLIVSIPDLCNLTFFDLKHMSMNHYPVPLSAADTISSAGPPPPPQRGCDKPIFSGQFGSRSGPTKCLMFCSRNKGADKTVRCVQVDLRM